MTRQAVEEPEPSELVPRLLARVHGRASGPLMVLDPSWPPALLSQARRTVIDSRDTLRDDDLVLFTSGSSGAPRGVVRTVASWAASLTALDGIVRPDAQADDAVWVPGPLSSSLFLYGALHAAWAGLPWHTAAVGTDMPDATHAHLVPLMLADALDAADRGLLPRLRTVVVAGAAVPDQLRERAERRGWRLVEYYGAAELSFVGWRPDGGAMRPFPGARVRIRLDEEEPGPAPRPPDGHIWVSSPYVARRYLTAVASDVEVAAHGAPADTHAPVDGPDNGPGDDAAARPTGSPGRGPWRTRDGWSTVHDVGRPSADGSGWTVLGRGTAAITTGGATVLADEVEHALRDVPGVRALVVVGVPHPRFGELVAVLVEPSVGADHSTLATLLRDRARALPSPARPRIMLWTDRLPRLTSGKVDRSRAAASAQSASPLR